MQRFPLAFFVRPENSRRWRLVLLVISACSFQRLNDRIEEGSGVGHALASRAALFSATV